MKLDITRLPVGEMLIGFVLVMVAVTFVGAFAAVDGGGEEAVSGSPTATGSPPPGSPTPGGSPSGIVAVAMVPTIKFDTEEMTVPANQEVTIRADNKDTGVLHNWAAYTDNSAKTVIARTDLCAAPCVKEVKFTAPAPGEYFFRCDVHPQQMVGKLIVK
ncbi:MAG: cupredoxin domain-containing protein [Chloroflexi bacterium]|nr:cupredoxin domain-containing protein [Chloroflexota bacterium]